jgi:hypothetical protein
MSRASDTICLGLGYASPLAIPFNAQPRPFHTKATNAERQPDVAKITPLAVPAYKRSVHHTWFSTVYELSAGPLFSDPSLWHTMRLPIYGVATAVCLIASVLAQDNQSSSNTNAVTEQSQSSQPQTQAASSTAANSNSQSQASSGSNSQSSASTSSAPPVTSVYSTAFETYSVSIDQALTGTRSYY